MSGKRCNGYNVIGEQMTGAMLIAHAHKVEPVAPYMQTLSELRPKYAAELAEAERYITRACEGVSVPALAAALKYHLLLAEQAAETFGKSLRESA